MNVLSVQKLTKKFGQKVAVDNVSFEVPEGTILGLLGPNGAGKSTVINMITGLLNKTSGTVQLFSEEMSERKRELRRKLGVVPQDLAIYYDLSAEENVRFFCGLYGIRGEELKNSVEQALRTVDLYERRKERPSAFSGGMQRRLNIAMAIAHRPALLIMDEPTVGIDPQSRNYILSAIEKMKENGTTIIYTSHYMEEVARLADEIVIIDQGQVIAFGSEEDLVSLVIDKINLQITVENPESLNIQEISDINGVINVSLEKQQLQIMTLLESKLLNQILMLLIKQEVRVVDVLQQAPDLETVFLSLTGRTLRD
ncbi:MULTISPECIES: ABC transporter ATP-binding protein [unclassified Enterococcus]|uniref:ABC transporter ATP-binding protein n=1 Tax=unclassified Enterococcus TaxID=2608891 RepID=UPI001A925C9A|nr:MULTISPECIES: ABC transporter ATP-binding protein [unclassified Enterococcus]MBO0460488.1 ABC transporter ATP-binding protein [Enterococcus sp. DIV1298c]MBO1299116.1 ABC transporter ATP-binding protein [Enterococcus sp. DIV1271a]